MAEEGNATASNVAASNDGVGQASETSNQPPENPQSHQGTEKHSNGAEDATANDQKTTTEEPEATEPLKAADDPENNASEGQEKQKTAGEKVEGGDAEEASQDQGAGSNGTPASTKKAAKRKSTGVPEHRSKKLTKKKSTPRIGSINAQPGEYYLAGLKGYPPWPSIICDEEMLTQDLIARRPKSAKLSDGTYNEQFQDGGKRVHERQFPVMFLHTNEFAWVPNTGLTPLIPEECAKIAETKGRNLKPAFEVAAEGHDLDYFKSLLADHELALQEDEAKEEAKKEKGNKKKRKSTNQVEEAEDEEAGDETTEKPKATKKRKKDTGSEGESEKPVKTPKTATKLKLTTPKAPGTGEAGKKTPAKARGASAKKGKQAAPVSDEEMEVDEPSKESGPKVDPAEEKARREKEVFYLRHRLQKGFLARDQVPKEDEMDAMSSYITKLASYDDLEISIIRKTKISKVLRGIIKLSDIPKESEYDFRGRSVALLKQWKHWDASAEGDQQGEPSANGVRGRTSDKEKDKNKDKEDTKEGAADAADDVPMTDAPEPEAEKEPVTGAKNTDAPEAEAKSVVA